MHLRHSKAPAAPPPTRTGQAGDPYCVELKGYGFLPQFTYENPLHIMRTLDGAPLPIKNLSESILSLVQVQATNFREDAVTTKEEIRRYSLLKEMSSRHLTVRYRIIVSERVHRCRNQCPSV